MWVGENESAKFWATVLNGLRNRGVEDIFIACTDNLTGFDTAIHAVFPETEIQNCIVHQLRNSSKYVSYKDLKALMSDLKAVYAVPLWKPQNTTVLSSIQLNGETAYTTYSGGTTSERFVDYLRNILIPTLSPDSIVVMDNMRSHHTKAVKDLLTQAGVHYLYLPPYSPDLNPIEKMWAKFKAFLRKAKVRQLEKLLNTVNVAFKTICPADCSGRFRFCGHSR